MREQKKISQLDAMIHLAEYYRVNSEFPELDVTLHHMTGMEFWRDDNVTVDRFGYEFYTVNGEAMRIVEDNSIIAVNFIDGHWEVEK